jgi:SAM-dependent methyltransferase
MAQIDTQIAVKGPDLNQLPFELRALSQATHYQNWVYRSIASDLGSKILEIGAGIGNMSKWLPVKDRLILTESDPVLNQLLSESFRSQADSNPKISVQKVNLVEDSLNFLEMEDLDTIVSFNVLEHIEDDALALSKLCHILRSSRATQPRRLITFVPAHQWAYGSMDQMFGHFRRYSSRSFKKLCRDVAPDASLRMRYFNSFGLAGWLLNGRVLRKDNISAGSIAVFEKLCPILAPVDDFVHQYLKVPLGQSLIAVLEWK